MFKKLFLSLLIGLPTANLLAQAERSYIEEIRHFQEELNAEYADPERSPLEAKDLKSFQGLPFFPIDSSLRIIAHLERTPGSEPFKMPTSTSRLPVYSQYGIAHFTIEGKEYSLPVYQSHSLRETEEYKDYLFLPFKDKTNSFESYGGGRYLDLRIPEGDSLLIDFNKAYNPYCAYSRRYSCPIPPAANRLPIPIKAGVMAPEEY